MRVREIMTAPVKTIEFSATVHQAAELMALHDVGALPVCEQGRVVGILTDRDIVLRCVAQGLQPETTDVRRIMTRDPVVEAPDAPIADAAWRFSSLRIRRLPIVEGGTAVGMLSSDDIARHWDDDAAVLRMVQRLAPRRRGLPPAGAAVAAGPLRDTI
jgi:CBS domain-containing protein